MKLAECPKEKLNQNRVKVSLKILVVEIDDSPKFTCLKTTNLPK
jgi:hypothetical protein